MMVKLLLKRYKYPPEGMYDAVQTVLEQCELWTDGAYDDHDDKVVDLRTDSDAQ